MTTGKNESLAMPEEVYAKAGQRWLGSILLSFAFILLAGCQTMAPVDGALPEDQGAGRLRSEMEKTKIPGAGCAPGSAPFPSWRQALECSPRSVKVIEPAALPDLDAILPRLLEKRAIFIGERHTNFSDHLNQLAIIRALHEQGKPLAIGMEFFQRPFQYCLDQFIAGELTETAFLACTEYFDRWRYDWRLYRPILDFAREKEIPLVALNISSEIVKKVSRLGWSSLSAVELAAVPKSIDRSNQDYEARLRGIYRNHPGRGGQEELAKEQSRDGGETSPNAARKPGAGVKTPPHIHGDSGHGSRGVHSQVTDAQCSAHHGAKTETGAGSFYRFLSVQLLWDEAMAERAASYLEEHQDRTMIVLAGGGHLAHGYGIPDRVRRRIPVETAIVLPAHDFVAKEAADEDRSPDACTDTQDNPQAHGTSDIADFLLVSEPRTLPPPAMLGVMLEGAEGKMQVMSFGPHSLAKVAGLQEGDYLTQIAGRSVQTMTDVRLALWDKQPGDRVDVMVQRPSKEEEDLHFEVELAIRW